MKNINNEIQTKYTQLKVIHAHACNLLEKNELEEVKYWVSLWENLVAEVETLILIRDTTNIVQISIVAPCLN
jgi:hypothetical protein